MNILANMNPQQAEAVQYTEGPLLILAGAGSGKTRVLTHRIAYLIEEKQVAPYHIMAITFTNKAAQEMRERVDQIVEFGSESIWVSTFHSSCVRILRRFIDRIGYENNFTIYDSDDQKTLMKAVIKKMQLDPKMYKERSLLSAISSAKNEMITPDQFEKNAGMDWAKKRIAGVYHEYQAELKKNNALDFDDLLTLTVELFLKCPDVLEYYQDKFQYLMVDEYQDTNTVQFKFVSLLASKYRNLCVVGDDDQSIYKFRGANIGNILGFEKVFADAKVIKLEQNYRSSQNILNAANEVISNNKGRKRKKLWTENEEGAKIDFRQFQNGFEEAEYVAGEISKLVRSQSAHYGDCAILYRTNAQSRLFEEKLMLANIPYKIVGGVNFYARKEIKDLLAYLKTVDNAMDDIAVQRIINVPRRGIGATTISRVLLHAQEQEINFYDALLEAREIPGLGRGSARIEPFTNYIQRLRQEAEYYSVRELLDHIIEDTGYVRDLEAEDTDEARARIENIDEFITKVVTYEEETEDASLSGFLQEVALVADIDSVEEGSDYVLLMTLHSAKGLEFPYVYLTGMEDGIFPSYMTITGDDPDELEEERRLCYVGITRAKKHLTMTSAQQRMIRGETQYNKVSRFVKEIPRELVELGRSSGDSPLRGGGTYDRSALFGGALQEKSSYQQPKFTPRQFTVNKADKLEYEVGDTVRHIKFGAGVVIAIVDGGKDYEVTVDFDQAGRKKMFASFAKLKKIG
ncbi:MAG: DNA helicase PcrA [Lachnospiraceae bacterium]|nr:DNA helicase PcrA [Lachnospiraceae bacterium]